MRGSSARIVEKNEAGFEPFCRWRPYAIIHAAEKCGVGLTIAWGASHKLRYVYKKATFNSPIRDKENAQKMEIKVWVKQWIFMSRN